MDEKQGRSGQFAPAVWAFLVLTAIKQVFGDAASAWFVAGVIACWFLISIKSGDPRKQTMEATRDDRET